MHDWEKYLRDETEELSLDRVEEFEDKVFLHCRLSFDSAECPLCHKVTDKHNGKYFRVIQDLPVNGKTVYLRVQNTVFFCYNDMITFNPELDFVKKKFKLTNRLVKTIKEKSKDMSFRRAEKSLRDIGIKTRFTNISNLFGRRRNG